MNTKSSKKSKPKTTTKAKKKPKLVKKAKEPFYWDEYDFNWDSYKLVFNDEPEEEIDNKPKKKKGKRLSGRDFDGAWTKEGHAYGPSNAGTVAGGAAPAGMSVAAGFGVGGFGAAGFGEASQRLTQYFSKFVKKLKSNGAEQALLDTVLDGYNAVFNTVAYNTSVILCGFQPELIDYMDFDVDGLVSALNEFKGDIISVYIGEHHNMISRDDLLKWYKYIGLTEDVIDSIIIVEKTNKIIDPDSSVFELNNKKGSKSTLNNLDDVDWKRALYKSIIVGCADPYLIGDLIMALSIHNTKFEIDNRFIYAI